VTWLLFDQAELLSLLVVENIFIYTCNFVFFYKTVLLQDAAELQLSSALANLCDDDHVIDDDVDDDGK